MDSELNCFACSSLSYSDGVNALTSALSLSLIGKENELVCEGVIIEWVRAACGAEGTSEDYWMESKKSLFILTVFDF